MFWILTSSLVFAISSASFCGDSSIPYSLEVLFDGQPVLGCARPTCFGWAPTGKPVTVNGTFFRINDHADGFIRNGRDSIPVYGPADARYHRPQTAVCDQSFTSSNCPGINQWVAGIAPLINVSAFPMVLQCCSFDRLLQSEDRGIASLRGGQIVIGGEVMSSGLQIGFDYVSDVLKVVHANGSLQYDVSIRRMPCPGLLEPYASSKLPKADTAAQAFQVPSVAVDQPLPLPHQNGVLEEVPNIADDQPLSLVQNGVLEEIIQEEAIQLPPGTQFESVSPPQNPAPPPPPQPPVAFQAPSFVPQTVPLYNYPPVAYGTGGGGGGGQWCFTADMTVELIDGTIKRMDELNKRDWVLTASDDRLEHVPVDYWIHRDPDQEAEFNEFEMEDGSTIKLTDKHYIYKGDCSHLSESSVSFSSMPRDAVTADEVRKGNCLFTLGENRQMTEVRVVRAEKVTQRGIYAPMTANGRIIVNGVHASCHNIMQTHSMGRTVFGYVDKIYNLYDRIFGSSTDAVEIPIVLKTVLAMADLAVPKNIATY